MSKGKLIVFTGPSGVGKATIEHELFKDESLRLRFSVSATTRAARPGEVHGEQYFFIPRDEFDRRIANDEFVEWNEHFSNKYGTLKSEIDRIMNQGYNPFLEIEVVGAKNIINKFGKDEVISIFIAPPSVDALRDRIKKRGAETDVQINERISRVDEEMTYMSLFEHVVVNDDLDSAVEKVKNIIRGEL